MKGIILAGGKGTRLFPSTLAISKQLLPVYDKPMIYYPLSTLMLAGIKQILIISTPSDTPRFQELLGNGHQLGLELSYTIQDQPNGLAQAFILGEKFINQDTVCLILGDNIFYGEGLSALVAKAAQLTQGAQIFAYWVKNPSDYGVVEIDAQAQVLSLEEKPKNPKSPWAVVGLYFYDNHVVSMTKTLKPSSRGEYEITDLNKLYLSQGQLHVELLGRGFAWMDAGTHNNQLDASNFIRAIEERQGLKIACLEEIAWRKGFINDVQLKKLAEPLTQSSYGKYLLELLNDQMPRIISRLEFD